MLALQEKEMEEPYLRLELKNVRPIELLDLTVSLHALGEAFEEYASREGFDPIRGNVKLYIQELQSGSIIADLKALLDQASFVFDRADVFAGFLGNLNDLLQFFSLGIFTRTERTPSRIEAERFSQFVNPIAKDGGAQLFLQINGDIHIDNPPLSISSDQANVVQNQITRFLGPKLPGSQNFQGEPMKLFQVRGDPKGTAGDKGIIEKFSSRPVRLQILNEAAKQTILDMPTNPLQTVFIVDGEVGFADGKPAVYKIFNVQDYFDQSELG